MIGSHDEKVQERQHEVQFSGQGTQREEAVEF